MELLHEQQRVQRVTHGTDNDVTAFNTDGMIAEAAESCLSHASTPRPHFVRFDRLFRIVNHITTMVITYCATRMSAFRVRNSAIRDAD